MFCDWFLFHLVTDMLATITTHEGPNYEIKQFDFNDDEADPIFPCNIIFEAEMGNLGPLCPLCFPTPLQFKQLKHSA